MQRRGGRESPPVNGRVRSVRMRPEGHGATVRSAALVGPGATRRRAGPRNPFGCGQGSPQARVGAKRV